MSDYSQWVDYVVDSLSMINTKYGCWAVLPFDGGYLDQPYRTMRIYDIILTQYRKNLASQLKK